jgi:hypothetical protein
MSLFMAGSSGGCRGLGGRTRPKCYPDDDAAKIDLVINASTAAARGLKVPQTLLVQAARVID